MVDEEASKNGTEVSGRPWCKEDVSSHGQDMITLAY